MTAVTFPVEETIAVMLVKVPLLVAEALVPIRTPPPAESELEP
jgi:hypothetical protein